MDRAFDELVGVGYLSVNGGRLWITRFEEAQRARSPGAARQAKYKDAKRQREEQERRERETGQVTSHEPSAVTSPADASVTSQIDETRRDETRTPKTPVVVTVAERARKVLANPHDGQWSRPSTWPEVVAICEAWACGLRIKLGDFPDGDSDLRAILQAIAAEEFTVEQLVSAGAMAKKSPYFARLNKPGPASFTAPVLRRLLGGPDAKSPDGDETGGYGSRSEWQA